MVETRRSSDSDQKSKSENPFLCSVRFIVAIMACLCLAIQYCQRMNLTMGIVCMVNKTAVAIMRESHTKPSVSQVTTEYLNSTMDLMTTAVPAKALKSKKKFKDGPFLWTKPIQGRLHSAYFFGYIAFQAGGGVMAYKYGPYRVLLSAMTLGTVTTFLTPMVAKIHYTLVLFLRFLTGLSAGVVWPAMVELAARWSPKDEKSIIMAIGNSGAQIGPLFSMPLYGALCASSFLGGWPLVFYVSGALGVMWCVACLLLLSSSPDDHKFISARERSYIQKNVVLKADKKQSKVPYRKIFSTVPCWAMFSSHFFKAFGFYTILTNVSTYNEEILRLDLKSSGILTAIPYICYFVFTIASGKIADWLIRKKIMEPGTCRKFFTGIGSFGPAASVFALGFIDYRYAWVGILMISLTLAFLGCNSGGGMYIVAQDMAPKYAGIIWGISNTFGTAPGIIVPLVIGSITKRGLLKEWRIVFAICAVSYIISGLAFVLFGSGKQQPWAVDRPDDATAEEMEKMTK